MTDRYLKIPPGGVSTSVELNCECSTCQYYISGGGATGTCQRSPPAVVTSSGKAYWPTVDATDWCGEYATIAEPA